MSRVAAVDIGTNSCRLLIASFDEGGTQTTIDRRLRITRLGQGVDASGRLAPEAIERVLTAVTEYAAVWQAGGVERVGIVATSATRDAANGAALTDALTRIAGVTPRVLTGDEEAHLSFRGATAWRREAPHDPLVVVDIGGGSTEVILGGGSTEVILGGGSTEVILGGGSPTASTSRQIGSVRLTERIMTDDPATPAQIAAARQVVDVELDAVEEQVDPGRAATLVGVAGTATTLAAIDAGVGTYVDGAVHGRVLDRAALSALTERLLAMTAGQIADLGPVQAGREDVLAAGALILDRIVERFGFAAVLISEHDILDGLAMELALGAGSVVVTDEAAPQASRAGEEMVEIVDLDGTVLEVIARREMRDRPQARHRCTYVVVVRTNGRVVVHQRAAWKDVSPSAWDLAFGGVCGVGEGWALSATRELEEEAGLTGVDLVDLGAVEWSNEESALIGRVFVAVHDGPLAPSDGEVVALDEVPMEDLGAWMMQRTLVDDSPVVVPPLLLAWWDARSRT